MNARKRQDGEWGAWWVLSPSPQPPRELPPAWWEGEASELDQMLHPHLESGWKATHQHHTPPRGWREPEPCPAINY